MGAESFTILAILEARDAASEIFDKIDESLDKFSGTAQSAADTAKEAGAAIDESLLQTASGANALDLADARVAAAEARVAAAMRDQAAAEEELLAAQAKAVEAGDADTAAADAEVAAADRLAAAQTRASAASRELTSAQKLQADTAEAVAAKNDAAADSEDKTRDASSGASAGLGAMAKTAGIVALGLGVAGAVMVKAAGNFQDSTTHLVTDAGESAKNLKMVQAGILQVSTATGQSAENITDAMYHIESGGYHGAAGLKLLQVAAEGARVGGADLDTVSKTLVGTMNAYGLSASHSASFMNQLIATTGAGDMRMQDLASALSTVAPLAARAGLQFSQVGGAIATMTAQGMSARQSTQDLAHTIVSLQNPNNVAIAEMQQMGVSSQDVQEHLGKRGLTGTIETLTSAITQHMGKSGLIIQNAFNQAKFAAQDADTEIKNMPPNLQTLAKGFLNGSITAQQWRTDLLGLSPVQQNLMKQFQGTAQKAHSFNTLLASGSPAAQTYTAALAKMMGGSTGLNTALMLSGSRMGVFQNNVNTVAAAAKKGGSTVDNWSTIQGTFNFKLASAKTAVENTGIAIGSALLPAATSLLQTIVQIVEPIAEWTAHHRTLTEVLFGTVIAVAAVIAVVGLAAKTYKAITGTLSTVKSGLQAVGLISKETAATQAESAEEAAAAEEVAAEESSGSWVTAAATTVASWAVAAATMIAQGAVWVATNVAKVALVVASNVAGALASAAAWIAANAVMLLGIGLIVVAIAAAVFLIIKYWKQISQTVETVWNDVYSFVSKVVGDVIGFVTSHWRLIIAIIGGPLGLAVALVTKYWGDIKKWFTDGVHDVQTVLAWFNSLPGRFGAWLADTADSVYQRGDRVLTWFRNLPGEVLSLISGLPGDMLTAGEHAIESLASGIVSAAGSALSGAMSSVASTIKSFLPFSPAKRGPLSGAGDPGQSGKSIAKNLAKGITSGASTVASAMKTLTTAARIQPGAGGLAAAGSGLTVPAGAAAGAGGQVINIDLRNTQVMSDRDMDTLVGKLGRALATRTIPQAGVKVRIR